MFQFEREKKKKKVFSVCCLNLKYIKNACNTIKFLFFVLILKVYLYEKCKKLYSLYFLYKKVKIINYKIIN